jgi:hypothetical protein
MTNQPTEADRTAALDAVKEFIGLNGPPACPAVSTAGTLCLHRRGHDGPHEFAPSIDPPTYLDTMRAVSPDAAAPPRPVERVRLVVEVDVERHAAYDGDELGDPPTLFKLGRAVTELIEHVDNCSTCTDPKCLPGINMGGCTSDTGYRVTSALVVRALDWDRAR